MTKEEIKNLPKPVKEAIAHAYKELGFSIRKIAEIMGIDKDTVLRYQKKELNEEWGQFADAIKKIYLEQDFELAQLAYKKMKEKIGKAKFFELVGLYKTVRELQKPQTPLVVNQTIFTQLKQKYGQL
jgi:predicted transcriptional regulator